MKALCSPLILQGNHFFEILSVQYASISFEAVSVPWISYIFALCHCMLNYYYIYFASIFIFPLM